MKTLKWIIISSVVVGCSTKNEDLISIQEKQDGIIVQANADQLAKLESKFSLSAETLSKNAGLYLIKGVSQDEVTALSLDVTTYANSMLQAPNRPLPKLVVPDSSLTPLQYLDKKWKRTNTIEEPNPMASIQCNTTAGRSPLAVIDIPTSDTIQKVGQPFKIDGIKSLSATNYGLQRQIHPSIQQTEEKIRTEAQKFICKPDASPIQRINCVPADKVERLIEDALRDVVRKAIALGNLSFGQEKLEHMWVIEDAVGKAVSYSGDSVELNPSRVGAYTVYLLSRDPYTQGCDLTTRNVMVTDNPELSPQPEARLRLKEGAEENFVQLAKTRNAEARKISTGKGTLIAVIDTGVNYNHPSLRPNIFVNEKEIPNNGIDDDLNGIVDDYIGYDFANKDPYPFDDDRHGTHVAGISAATDLGLAPDAKILAIKALPGSISDIIKSMDYAVKMGADVINMSLRGYATDPMMMLMMSSNNPFEAVIATGKTKSTFVLAAGNETLNNDVQVVWPANSNQPNAITIAAIDENDTLTSYSNFGLTQVDMASYGGTMGAPIFSTNLHTDIARYLGISGTSMATPVVSGIAAQIKEILPSATGEEVVEILRRSAVESESLRHKIRFGSYASSLNAVTLASQLKMTLP